MFRPRRADGKKYKVWYYKYKDASGKWVKKPGFTDKQLTEIELRHAEKAVERELCGGLKADRRAERQSPWPEVCDLYLQELSRRGVGQKRQKGVQWILKKIGEGVPLHTLASVRIDTFTAYLGRRASEGMAPGTQNEYRRVMMAFLRHFVRMGWLEEHPLKDLSPVKVGATGRRRLRRSFTRDELARLVAAGRKDRPLMYQVAAFSGFRRIELARILKEDCSPLGERPRWHVDGSRTKNGLPALLPMTPDCAKVLRERWLQTKPGERLFPYDVWPRDFAADRARAGIAAQDSRGRWADFHSLRYTFCALLAERFPIEIVSKLMRHSTIQLTTAVYLDLGLDCDGERAWVLPSLLGPVCGFRELG